MKKIYFILFLITAVAIGNISSAYSCPPGKNGKHKSHKKHKKKKSGYFYNFQH